MSSLIVADKLTKWFGPRLAVDGVSLEVGGGEVMGLLGPNGSGKTTILRMLTGYLRPSAGTASVSGLDVVDEPLEVRRRIGYVPEDVPLYDWMRVSEFLTFMARLKGLPGRAVPTAVSSVIERLALGSVIRLPIGKLSRGFRQRAAIAQALLNGRLLATHSLRREGPGVRVRLRVRGIEGQVRACLERVSGVQGVTVQGPEPAAYVVDVATPSAREALAAAVVGNGFALLELEDVSADLETVFLE